MTAKKGHVTFNKSLTISVPQVSLSQIQRGSVNVPQGSVWPDLIHVQWCEILGVDGSPLDSSQGHVPRCSRVSCGPKALAIPQEILLPGGFTPSFNPHDKPSR